MADILAVDVTYAARRPWVPRRAQFESWVRAALSGARRCTVLSVRVVGAARSRSLNARYRHKDRPTNVLSFSGAGLAPDGSNYLGELVICAPVVAREALAQGKSTESHWAHMTVHGVLHLLGFDHERHAEAEKMAAREIQILDRLGFSNPYV
ncbi:MAG: rRNA maturation RNase YbeY [Steroidobacteraceae bacterium]|jgi:probable rRNA maturation factor